MLPMALSDKNLKTFVNMLMSEKFKRAALKLGKPDAIDGSCIEVSKILAPIYPQLQCHHNCRIHQLNNQGDVIYGWNLLTGMIEGDLYCVAQHHAIWKKNGQCLDVTPEANPAITKITFLPDNRLQIGHGITISIPPLFVWGAAGAVWANGIKNNSPMKSYYFETNYHSSASAISALKLSPP
ncbi:hypothetical protein AFK24_24715 [Pseudomonas syringae]|uniref:Uncharacterized protein n=1 Tax=Pseudomonas syringae TaxID=317 RepID=A0A1C7Z2B9_PSESX|nr:hypothetical protein [Pseudomonas syringae]OCR22315.1 hypothetical protein AFK24_24715 [Pseudomonas syringae]